MPYYQLIHNISSTELRIWPQITSPITILWEWHHHSPDQPALKLQHPLSPSFSAFVILWHQNILWEMLLILPTACIPKHPYFSPDHNFYFLLGLPDSSFSPIKSNLHAVQIKQFALLFSPCCCCTWKVPLDPSLTTKQCSITYCHQSELNAC